MSRYSRYPHQNAHVPQQLRNPWISEAPLRPSESQSTNSSSSSRTYRGGGGAAGPGPPPQWLHHLPPESAHHPFNHLPPRAAQYAVLDHQVAVLDGANHLLPPTGSASGGPAKHYSSSSRAASDRDRPVTPASSPGGGSGGGAVDGCGGHCVAFDNFCYYCLQVVFMAGILIGVSLTIAGSVLRSQQRGGDLLVLVYIGCMLAMVCAVLLAVQCCVRRNVKRRKRALRQVRDRTRRPAPAPVPSDMIPLQELAAPLLVRLVQQNPAADIQRHGQYHSQPPFRCVGRPGGPALDEGQMDTSRSGTPWWRRRGELETRH